MAVIQPILASNCLQSFAFCCCWLDAQDCIADPGICYPVARRGAIVVFHKKLCVIYYTVQVCKSLYVAGGAKHYAIFSRSALGSRSDDRSSS